MANKKEKCNYCKSRFPTPMDRKNPPMDRKEALNFPVPMVS
jgi:hypothetical protein